MLKDLLTSLVLIALGSGVLLEALRMPRYERLGVNPYTVPGLVPGALGIVVAVFGLILLARTVVAWRRGHAVPGDTAAAAGTPEPGSAPRVVLTLALTLGYGGLLIGRMPFAWATFAFVLAFLLAFQWTPALIAGARRGPLLRSVGTSLLQAGLVAVIVTYVFERIFLVRLPS